MNAQHRINKRANRERRINRRIAELNGVIANRNKEAAEKYIPDNSKEHAQINRLKQRYDN